MKQSQNMRLKIVQAGEPVLRQAARPLAAEEIAQPQTRRLIEWMRETMRDAPGVGLAAPQVGLPLQLVVIEDPEEALQTVPPEQRAERLREPVPFHALLNPRIVRRSEEQAEFFEGCLSVAGFGGLVKRSLEVTVEYLDPSGAPQCVEARGWYARILQHEIDHLEGRLYIDRMETRSFSTLDNLNRHWKDLPVRNVREALGLESGARSGSQS
jgi:peptide deformylase